MASSSNNLNQLLNSFKNTAQGEHLQQAEQINTNATQLNQTAQKTIERLDSLDQNLEKLFQVIDQDELNQSIKNLEDNLRKIYFVNIALTTSIIALTITQIL